MPCYDGQRDADEARMRRHLDALTALFCAYLERPGEIAIKNMADEWRIRHNRVDRARRRKDFKDEIQTQVQYGEFMDALHKELCT